MGKLVKKLPGSTKPKVLQENPFSFHHNKRKTHVLGQYIQGLKGKPVQARQKAFDLRSKTLLMEYKNKHKNNLIIDKRIGEGDSTLSKEEKMDMRRMEQLKKLKHKNNLYNLNEVNEDLLCNVQSMNNNEDDHFDIEEDGVLDAKFVADHHFGGVDDTEESVERKNMSQKDRHEEIIQKSKQERKERKDHRQSQQDHLEDLNSRVGLFRNVMGKYLIGTSDMTNLRKKRRTELHDEFDEMMVSVKKDQFLGKVSVPTDRVKSDKEIRMEEVERVTRLEEERLKRMKAEYEDNSKFVTPSVDSLSIQPESDHAVEKTALEYKDGVLVNSEMHENKKSYPSQVDTQSQFTNNKQPKSILKPALTAVTVEVPKDYESFWLLLSNKTPTEVSKLVTNMIDSHHPSLKHSNKIVCSDILSYMLQTFKVLCEHDSNENISTEYTNMEYLDCLMPCVNTLTTLDPDHSARAMLLIFVEKRDEYRSLKKKRYPFLDTFIHLKMAGNLFPASDFHHPVMTPVKTFLTQLLGEARIRDARGVFCALFYSTLLYQYIQESGKFVSELKQLLFGLLLRCIPSDKLDAVECPQETISLKWLLSNNLPGPKQLVITKNCSKLKKLPIIDLSMINDESLEFTNGNRCVILDRVLWLISSLCTSWGKLPSVRTIMSPVSLLLSLLPREEYPQLIRDKVTNLEEAIAALPSHPEYLKVDRGRPKPLRMYEPEIKEIKIRAPKSAANKSKRQIMQEKLVHMVKKSRKGAKREILKDNHYLTQQKLRDTLKSDAERKKKVNLIMHELKSQEGDCKKYEKLKMSKR